MLIYGCFQETSRQLVLAGFTRKRVYTNDEVVVETLDTGK